MHRRRTDFPFLIKSMGFITIVDAMNLLLGLLQRAAVEKRIDFLGNIAVGTGT